MNIWILNHYATPPDTPGITRHFDFATELIKRGHKVFIFAAGFNHRTQLEERLKGRQNSRRENIGGVEFIWVKTCQYKRNDWRRVVNMLSYTFRVTPLGVKLKEAPDVVLASSPHPFTGLAGYIVSRVKRAQFIFEVRDLWPETFVGIGGYGNRSPVVWLLSMLEKFLYQRAQKIVVLAPRASDYITKFGIPIDKISHIPNGVNIDWFHNASVQLPEELAELIDGLRARAKILVGYTGAHGIANALETIIESAKLLQDRRVDNVHFLLVGDGPEKERLVRIAKNDGLKNISFFKSIPKNAMPRLLNNIDIAIVPLRKSNLFTYGVSMNKLFDYMVCARPIVWAVESANNPVAEANCGLSVPPEDPEKLAEAVVQLCNLGEKERRDMGTMGYQYVIKYHSTAVLANKLLEILEDLKIHSTKPVV